MKSKALGQNFLRSKRTARRVAYLAGVDDGSVCVDLGAGNGTISEASLRRAGPVLAVEMDERLVHQLRQRFANEPRVKVVHGDLNTAPVPKQRFVIAANPPFNQSTVLIRRWLLAESFVSCALIVEKSFAGRVSGAYGATKLSVSFAPYISFEIGPVVRSIEFAPQPRVPTVILLAKRREAHLVPWGDRHDYWRFVNFLFERSQRLVGDALKPLKLTKLSPALQSMEVRDLTVEDALTIYSEVARMGESRIERIQTFEASLPPLRRVRFGG